MSQLAQITGPVAYRQGDGANITIRPGPVTLELTPLDATLSWTDDESHGSAAMPLSDFNAFVAQGFIKVAA